MTDSNPTQEVTSETSTANSIQGYPSQQGYMSNEDHNVCDVGNEKTSDDEVYLSLSSVGSDGEKTSIQSADEQQLKDMEEQGRALIAQIKVKQW